MKPSHTPPPKWPFADAKQAITLQAVSEDRPSVLRLFEGLYSGKSARSAAIKAKCLECCWMDEKAIRECCATECPLHGFRPYQQRRAK